MSILAMDTSSAHCTAAFAGLSAGVDAPTGHAEHLAGLIQQVVPDISEIRSIVVGVGPGPYTGLRVGVVTAVTMAEALGVPVAGVCSLDGLGARIGDGVVVTDARRREVFAARYAAGRRVEGPMVIAPARVRELWPEARVVGPAVQRYPDLGEFAQLDAADLLEVPADLPARPWYLREPDAKPQ
ncbi:MAG: tRNA (adenosine(37)-N6)-threonylcarbamoyltransferase complex dimerization subunit type 1 TsaB [Candidatus Nanopelagicales bacterium]|nr:tRNA (adenosine(37)-N6)-threonylcarbamoyltransferase complex dimerization subunit type 1 TsaB [Candidatus Nanopelagicales bacterium]